jgi:hypothetical protein
MLHRSTNSQTNIWRYVARSNQTGFWYYVKAKGQAAWYLLDIEHPMISSRRGDDTVYKFSFCPSSLIGMPPLKVGGALVSFLSASGADELNIGEVFRTLECE